MPAHSSGGEFLRNKGDQISHVRSKKTQLHLLSFLPCLLKRKRSNTGSIIFTDTDHGKPGSGSLAMKKVAVVCREEVGGESNTFFKYRSTLHLHSSTYPNLIVT